MNEEPCETAEEAVRWIKDHKKEVTGNFASLERFPAVKNPFSVFMAGAPGVGKTEFSKSFIETYYTVDDENKVVRIDTDEVRAFIPGYTGAKAPLFQRAAAQGIEYLIDSTHENLQNVCIDTTFGLARKAESNIQRALGRKRKTGIFYLYQDPLLSWEYTKMREKLEGRVVPTDFFIESLFGAAQNVNNIKKLYGDAISLSVIVFGENHNITLSKFNITNVDGYAKIPYTKEELLRKLK